VIITLVCSVSGAPFAILSFIINTRVVIYVAATLEPSMISPIEMTIIFLGKNGNSTLAGPSKKNAKITPRQPNRSIKCGFQPWSNKIPQIGENMA